MTKKKLLGVGLALAAVAGIITSGVVLADGSHKTAASSTTTEGENVPATQVSGNGNTSNDDAQEVCACPFVIEESGTPVPDTSVYSVDPVTGEIKYGYKVKLKVKFLDCPCAQNDDQMFPLSGEREFTGYFTEQ